MKKIFFLFLLSFSLFWSCEDRYDTFPITMEIHCKISKLSPKDSVKVSLECLERKGKDVFFYINRTRIDRHEKGKSVYYPEKSAILFTRKEIEGTSKILIDLQPYAIDGVTQDLQEKIEGTKLTYVLRIYEDDKLYLERTLNFPQESSRSILHLSL